jgi:hypothetical protein
MITPSGPSPRPPFLTPSKATPLFFFALHVVVRSNYLDIYRTQLVVFVTRPLMPFSNLLSCPYQLENWLPHTPSFRLIAFLLALSLSLYPRHLVMYCLIMSFHVVLRWETRRTMHMQARIGEGRFAFH